MVKNKQLNKADQKFYKANREHKSSLFCLSLREKKDLLELYNAINGSDYQNPEELIIYTIEDAVYIGIKNDISFLFGEMLSLYEHQSSQNPNMPMRGLLYLARNYESYIDQNSLNIYGSKQLTFPLPQYYVFYNGTWEEPDRQELRLTDAFPKIDGKEPCLECKAVLLNINYGHNAELLKKCKRLKDYAQFIHYIRRNQAESMNLTDAVDEAIDRCIKENVLKELLLKCRGEVRDMVLTTFNKELYERDLKETCMEEGRAEGMAQGRAEGMAQGRAEGMAQGLAEGLAEGLAQGLEKGETLTLIKLIQKKFRKNKSLSEIAVELEEEDAAIEPLYLLIAANPEKSENEILEMMKK